MAVSCAPCAFGAVSSSLLSYPVNILTGQVEVTPTIIVLGNATTTSFATTTIFPTGGAPGTAPTTTITYTASSQLTWETLGTTLSYPTTYVDYLGFAGVAATAAASPCAQSLQPTPLSLPPNIAPASLVYPNTGNGALPTPLLSYLDTLGLPAQLGGNKLETCIVLQNLVGATPTVVSIGAFTSTTTIPLVVTTTKSSGVVLATSASAQTVTQAVLFTPNSANPVLVSGTVSTTLTAPLAVTLPGGSVTTFGPTTGSAVHITNVLSSIARSQSGAYTNTTAPATGGAMPTGPTTTHAAYAGLAATAAPMLANACVGVLACAAAALCL